MTASDIRVARARAWLFVAPPGRLSTVVLATPIPELPDTGYCRILDSEPDRFGYIDGNGLVVSARFTVSGSPEVANDGKADGVLVQHGRSPMVLRNGRDGRLLTEAVQWVVILQI